MKLFVRLFYILFFVFLAGIILLIAVPPTSVMSRVATGLVTGSFIGLVNALANYYHLRQAYFEQMVDALMSISQELRMDYIKARARNAFIQDMSQQEMIKYADEHESVEDTIKETDAMQAKYGTLVAKIDFDAFVSLVPFASKRIKELLDSIDKLLAVKVSNLHGMYQICFDFTLLSANVSKEEQELVIGDPDEFYAYSVQNNVDYQDVLAFILSELAEDFIKLAKSTKRILSKSYDEYLKDMADFIKRGWLKDVIIRDVWRERAERLDEDTQETGLDEDSNVDNGLISNNL